MSVFETLNNIDVGEHIEEKNGLSYLSWAWAWAEVKKHFPEAFYTIYENSEGLFYHTDGKTAWVKTGVTIDALEMIEFLPVMDYRNKSIPIENITSFDVNKAIQRSLTKACARHGLGLYIYAGEDLPEAKKQELKNVKLPNANDFNAAMDVASVTVADVRKLIEETKTDVDKVANAYKVKSLDDLTEEQLRSAFLTLKKKASKSA